MWVEYEKTESLNSDLLVEYDVAQLENLMSIRAPSSH